MLPVARILDVDDLGKNCAGPVHIGRKGRWSLAHNARKQAIAEQSASNPRNLKLTPTLTRFPSASVLPQRRGRSIHEFRAKLAIVLAERHKQIAPFGKGLHAHK